jgi:hypothetical protein
MSDGLPREAEARTPAAGKLTGVHTGELDSDLAAWLRLNLLKPRLAESHTTVIIPLDDRVIFVSALNRA